ncbi:MAG TPA: alkaline phosphatase [Anaerolineae bacterium]|nr:alkaline phosphatase [Anaerolineae bacterium]
MRQRIRVYSCFLISLFLFLLGVTYAGESAAQATSEAAEAYPKHVLLFLADGLGYEHLRAASYYAYGVDDGLFMQSLPYGSSIATHSADEAITDSAAAGTAISTGYKVNNGVLAQAIPGDTHELPTILEYYQQHCWGTALVTNTSITHATPAAFGAHEFSRANFVEIAHDYLYQTKPNILLGGGASGMTVNDAVAAGYLVATNRTGLEVLSPIAHIKLSGQFGNNHMDFEYDYMTGQSTMYDTMPHLTEMVEQTLRLLDNDVYEGTFVMIEGGRIDHAGHLNSLSKLIEEVLAFDESIQIAYEWAQNKDDVLIVVTSDHETGNLMVLENNGVGQYPTHAWGTTNHTAEDVPVFGWGVNAHLIVDVRDNTDVYDVLRAGQPAPPPFCWLDEANYLPVAVSP